MLLNKAYLALIVMSLTFYICNRLLLVLGDLFSLQNVTYLLSVLYSCNSNNCNSIVVTVFLQHCVICTERRKIKWMFALKVKIQLVSYIMWN